MLIPVVMFVFNLKRPKSIIKILKIFLLYSIHNQNLHIEFLARFKLKINVETSDLNPSVMCTSKSKNN